MKVKTSISLSEHIIRQLEEYTDRGERSEFIEQALVYYLNFLRKKGRDTKDLEILNRNSGMLNAEAEDTLGYQDLP